ncbi:hypothetical protein BSKO_09344 [Bryopsis sp. KO-2023]|nr:hypothetical protein BSKO_09344 [Bryopsis sp. KO-2023]
MSEPFCIIAHVWLRFRRKLWVEGLATFSRCFVTAALLYITEWRPEFCFSAAQISFGAITFLGYGMLLPEIFSKAGGRILEICLHFDPGVLQLSLSFLVQSLVKLILTEGSNYVLVMVESQHSQGVFGVVTGLGSLVVRTIFQPIEEAAFLAFSRAGISREDASGMRELNRLLTSLVRAVSLIGLLAAVFGPPHSTTLLRILYSEKWSNTEAPTVLGWYCAYILLLAVNGVTEAFVHAVLDARSLFSSNAWMVGVAIVHMSASAMLSLKFGSVGLILADGVGMCLRIAFSMWCIRNHFPKHVVNFTHILPSPRTLLALAAACWISWFVHFSLLVADMEFLPSACIEITTALLSASGVLFVMYKSERAAWEMVLTSKSSVKKEE